MFAQLFRPLFSNFDNQPFAYPQNIKQRGNVFFLLSPHRNRSIIRVASSEFTNFSISILQRVLIGSAYYTIESHAIGRLNGIIITVSCVVYSSLWLKLKIQC